MVNCMKCGNPIPRLPLWLGDVKVGFVCDACKTRPAAAFPARRRKQQTDAPAETEEPEVVEVVYEETEETPKKAATRKTASKAEEPEAPEDEETAKKAKKVAKTDPGSVLGKALVRALTGQDEDTEPEKKAKKSAKK